MNEIRVKSFNELHDALKSFRGNPHSMFRGQRDSSWPLIPKAQRTPFNEIRDAYTFNQWKSDATQFILEKPRTELEWLALAQHHGLATRLLDWSRNPLAAAFFAVWKDGVTDAVLYALNPREVLDADYSGSLLDAKTKLVYAWFPDAISPRIIRQRGVFTIHQPGSAPLRIDKDTPDFLCILIDKDYRETLREELSYYGITRSSLFPDLDGLASHHNWKVQIDLRNSRNKKNQK